MARRNSSFPGKNPSGRISTSSFAPLSAALHRARRPQAAARPAAAQAPPTPARPRSRPDLALCTTPAIRLSELLAHYRPRTRPRPDLVLCATPLRPHRRPRPGPNLLLQNLYLQICNYKQAGIYSRPRLRPSDSATQHLACSTTPEPGARRCDCRSGSEIRMARRRRSSRLIQALFNRAV